MFEKKLDILKISKISFFKEKLDILKNSENLDF